MSHKHDRSGRGRKPKVDAQAVQPAPTADIAVEAVPALIEQAAIGMTASAEVLAMEVAIPADIEIQPAPAGSLPLEVNGSREIDPPHVYPGDAAPPVADRTNPNNRAQSALQQEQKTMNETIQQNADQMRQAGEQFRGAAESAMNTAQGQAQETMERNTRLMSEMGDLARGNMEAAVQSSRIAVEGYQAIGREAVEFGRKSFEGFSSTVRQLAEAKTPADVLRVQGEWARQAFDNAVAAGAQMSERMVKLAGETAQPLQSRVAVATERFQQAA